MLAIPKEGRGKRGKKTQAEKDYISRAIEFGCLLSYHKYGHAGSPAEWNHSRTHIGAGCIARHCNGYALSPEFHRLGNTSLSALGRKGWEAFHGVTEQELIDLSKKMFDAPY